MTGKGNPGRSTKLTPALIQEAEKLVAAGVPYNTCAAYFRLTERSWYHYLAWGRRAHEGHRTLEDRKPIPHRKLALQFFQSITRARARYEMQLTGVMGQAATGIRDKAGDLVVPPDWRAALEVLKRRFPENWRERIAHEGGDPEKPIPVKILGFDPSGFPKPLTGTDAEEEANR